MIFHRQNKWKSLIADHKCVEQMLRQLGMITEQATEGTIVIDLKGIVHFVNTAWARMHGYKTSNEVLGKDFGVFFTKEQAQTQLAPLIEQTKHKGWSRGRVDNVRADGTTLPTQMKITALKGDGDKINGFMVFATDNSECRRLEDKLNQTSKQAELLKQQTQQLQNQIAEHEQVKESLKQQIDQLTTASEQLQRNIDDYKPQEQVYSDDSEPPEGFAWKGGPFDAEELKAVAELARRLG